MKEPTKGPDLCCPYCDMLIDAASIPDAIITSENGRRMNARRVGRYRGGRKLGAKDKGERKPGRWPDSRQ